MKNKALIIQDIDSQPFESNALTVTRDLVREYCYTRHKALSAIQSTQYQCVVVSMDMEYENPLGIIEIIRVAENKFGLTPNLILVVGRALKLTQLEMAKFNIVAQILLHHLK